MYFYFSNLKLKVITSDYHVKIIKLCVNQWFILIKLIRFKKSNLFIRGHILESHILKIETSTYFGRLTPYLERP